MVDWSLANSLRKNRGFNFAFDNLNRSHLLGNAEVLRISTILRSRLNAVV